MSMFDGPCPHGRASEFDCDECSYSPSAERWRQRTMLWRCSGCGEHNTELMADSLRGQLDAENRELAALNQVEQLTAALGMLVKACRDGQIYTIGGAKLLVHAEKALTPTEKKD